MRLLAFCWLMHTPAQAVVLIGALGLRTSPRSCCRFAPPLRLSAALNATTSANLADGGGMASSDEGALTTWSTVDVASGSALFVLLHTITQSTIGGNPDGVVACGRLVSTGAFVAVQQAAGLPASSWLPRGDGHKEDDPLFQSPLAPLLACTLLAAASLGPAFAIALFGHPADASQLLPSARELPSVGRGFELLLAAPVWASL
ncbi:MAG: hypothetical protein SGPRY_001622 [Prymnesium sp.]